MKRIPNTPVAWVFNSAGSQSTLNTHNPLQYQGDTLSTGPKTIAEELDEETIHWNLVCRIPSRRNGHTTYLLCTSNNSRNSASKYSR